MTCCQRSILAQHGPGLTRRRKSTRTTKETPAAIVAEADKVEAGLVVSAIVEVVAEARVAEVVPMEGAVDVVDRAGEEEVVDVATRGAMGEDFSEMAISVASCRSLRLD